MMEARETNILGRISQRLDLKLTGAPFNLLVPPLLNLVVGIDETLRELKLVSAAVDISTANAFPFQVPASKRWRLWAANREATVGNTRILLQQAINNAVSLTTASNAAAAVNFTGLPMGPGWQLGLAQGNVADTAVGFYIIYEEEDVF